MIFAFGIVFLVARPFSNSTPTPNEPARVPKQPRVVLRPGSKASVEHNRSIALAAEEQSKLKKLDQTEKKSIAVRPRFNPLSQQMRESALTLLFSLLLPSLCRNRPA